MFTGIMVNTFKIHVDNIANFKMYAFDWFNYYVAFLLMLKNWSSTGIHGLNVFQSYHDFQCFQCF